MMSFKKTKKSDLKLIWVDLILGVVFVYTIVMIILSIVEPL